MLDFRAAFRAPPFRRAGDFRRDDLRAVLELRLERLRAPPLFFLPLLERLDFLAAAIGRLRVAGFVERIARFAHNE